MKYYIKKHLGCDEAGKGAVLGPIIFVGYIHPGIHQLCEKDSKAMTPIGRVEKYSHIGLSQNIILKSICPDVIDKYVSKKQLNILEAEAFSDIIHRFRNEKKYYVILDSFEQNTSNLKYKMCSSYRISPDNFVLECKADEKYDACAAASICAKVIRDNYMKDLSRKIGHDLGSGYPSDPKTIKWLKSLSLKDFRYKYRKYIRLSWKTVKSLFGGLDLEYE